MPEKGPSNLLWVLDQSLLVSSLNSSSQKGKREYDSFMVIETARLLLRPWVKEDAPSLFEYAKDPEVALPTGWQPHTSVENSLEVIEKILSSSENFALTLKDEGKAIGSIGLHKKSNDQAAEGDLEIGFWIGKPYWGQGLVPEAVRALLSYAFEEVGVKTVWCCYYLGNEKSKRCQEKCGFVFSHLEENSFIAPLGEYRTKVYSRIDRETYDKLSLKN